MDKRSMLEAMISHYTNGNKAKFAGLLGVSAQTISAWGTRNTFDHELIYTKCRDISADWLLTGEGSMLRSNDEQPLPYPSSASIPSGEDSFIYKMYEKEKEENKALFEEVGGLKERIRTLESQLQEYESTSTPLKGAIQEPCPAAKNVSTKKSSLPNADNVTSVTAR